MANRPSWAHERWCDSPQRPAHWGDSPQFFDWIFGRAALDKNWSFCLAKKNLTKQAKITFRVISLSIFFFSDHPEAKHLPKARGLH